MATRIGTTVLLAAAWAATTAALCPAQASAATASRCGRTLLHTQRLIIETDARILARCALLLVESPQAQSAESVCRALRVPELGVARMDKLLRSRIEQRCAASSSPWLPARCPGPGVARGIALDSGASLALCTSSSAHCRAVQQVSSLFSDFTQILQAQHAGNLTYEFGGMKGNTFAACLAGSSPGTSTTTSITTTTTTTSTTLAINPPGNKQIVITEIMANPLVQADSLGEYFEVFNGGTVAVNLEGATIHDLDSDHFEVDRPLLVEAGGYVVFARSPSAADSHVDYVYGSAMTLANSADELVLVQDGQELDAVAYDMTFPLQAGHSMELSTRAYDSLANDLATSWCPASMTMTGGDFGSPGFAATTCEQTTR